MVQTTITGFIKFGIENGESQHREKRWSQLDDFTQRILIAPWDEEAARHYGSIRALLNNEGNIIGNNDNTQLFILIVALVG